MRPVTDFELLSHISDFEALDGRARQEFGIDAPHSRLRDTGFRWFGEEQVGLTLCYKGRRIDEMAIFRGKLRFQFKTGHGFLVLLSSPAQVYDTFAISIYYILDEFRGSDWGILRGRETETAGGWMNRVLLQRVDEPKLQRQAGPEPLEDYKIEDGRSLAFKVRRLGWYRLRLYEADPRRFLISDRRYEPINSRPQHRRYFSVRGI